MRREKAEADRRISTMLVALYTGAAELRHYVHPWWRHLPPEIQEVLHQIKASLQRTIGLVPVIGKLANEELGRRGLRAGRAQDLELRKSLDPDLASHMLLSVTRHLLSHVPAEIFPTTIKWACYAIGHQAVALDAQDGVFSKEVIPVGKENPPHPGDKLSTLYEDCATIKHHHDWLMALPEESLPCLILHGLPTHHRHVFLTAEVLITMRQALEQPSLSTDDHLKFQGLDATSGAQLMEVLSSELDHRMPSDWPKVNGTVAALAGQMSSHMAELKPSKKSLETPRASAKARPKEKAQAKAKATTKDAPKPPKATRRKTVEKVLERMKTDAPEGGLVAHFNRHATLRVLQQVGYFMAEQGEILDTLLRPEDAGTTQGHGPRQSRYISVTDKLFEMADRATHDHCSFVLAVVLYHMVLRGLLLRVVYHRAAIAVQQKFRYIRSKGQKSNAEAPAIFIQRYWRGLSAALCLMRQDDAAEQIQRNYRAWKWNMRSSHLLKSALTAQRVWHGAVHRKWLRQCQRSARIIQRHARGMLVRMTLDGPGREIAFQHQDELNAILRRKEQMPETEFIARTAVIAGKARVALHRHREKNLDLRRMAGVAQKAPQARLLDKQKRLKMVGAMQPARLSVFEPMVFALKRLEPPRDARYGHQQSRVMMQLTEARQALERSLPPERKGVRVAAPHATAKRGRAAVAARRLAKRPVRPAEPKQGSIDEESLRHWMHLHLGPPDLLARKR